MTLRNCERTYPYKFHGLCREIKSLAPKYFGAFNKKASFFWQIFDDSGVFAPNNAIIESNAFLFNVWKQS